MRYHFQLFLCSCVRVQLPQVDEIESQLAGRTLTTISFFLDETFEELMYDVTTTVTP